MTTLANSNNLAGRSAAAAVALAAALPGLRVPFLSDDWAQVAAASKGWLIATPFRDFRPLFMILYWIDLKVWGARALGFHLTNMALIGLAAALVVGVAERCTDDKRVSTMAGVLFALHPYHVENAAWIAGRSDSLQAVFYLLAVLSFERWRTTARRLPYAAMALTEAALLSKESAITMSALLALRCILIADPRERRRTLRSGVLPIFLLTSAHFLILRPLALSGFGRTLVSGFGFAWLKAACGFAAATIVALEAERLSYRPVLWGAVAIAAWLLLLASGFSAGKRMPRVVWVALCAFAVLVSPSIVGFQERYLFLPVAASCLAIAALLAAARPALGRSLLLAILSTWVILSAGHWRAWYDASLASEQLVGQLTAETKFSKVEEIVIANIPLRVAGASVAGDFQAALGVLGARPVPVKAAAWVSYPSAGAVALAGPPEWAPQKSDPQNVVEVTVRLEVRDGPFRRYVGPALPQDQSALRTSVGELVQESPDLVRVTLQASRGRSLFAWDRGRLIPLTAPTATAH